MPFTKNQKQTAVILGLSTPRLSILTKQKLVEGKHYIKQGRKLLYDPVLAESQIRATHDPQQDHQTTTKTRANIKPKSDTQKTETITAAGFGELDYSEARTENERYKAALKKIEYEVKAGELLPLDPIKKAWAFLAVNTKTKVLSIKSKMAPELRSAITDDSTFYRLCDILDNLLREALEEIANTKYKS